MLLLLLLRRLCLAPARWALLRLLAPVPRLPLRVLFLLGMRLCPRYLRYGLVRIRALAQSASGQPEVSSPGAPRTPLY